MLYSCLYYSSVPVPSSFNYDIATYREKIPHSSYGEKIDLMKYVLVPEKKNNRFLEIVTSFKCEVLLLFFWLCYFPSEPASYCLYWVLFANDFPTKVSRVKISIFRALRDLAKCCFLL